MKKVVWKGKQSVGDRAVKRIVYQNPMPYSDYGGVTVEYDDNTFVNLPCVDIESTDPLLAACEVLRHCAVSAQHGAARAAEHAARMRGCYHLLEGTVGGVS